MRYVPALFSYCILSDGTLGTDLEAGLNFTEVEVVTTESRYSHWNNSQELIKSCYFAIANYENIHVCFYTNDFFILRSRWTRCTWTRDGGRLWRACRRGNTWGARRRGGASDGDHVVGETPEENAEEEDLDPKKSKINQTVCKHCIIMI